MRRFALAVWLAAALLAVFLATLTPAAPSGAGYLHGRPLLGDLLRNLLLFLPLGAACAARGAAPKRVLAGAVVLSAAIEIAQLAIPGRNANPWDALANTAGAGLGAAMVQHARRWLAPSPAARAGLAVAAAALAAGWLLLGAWLTAPSPPPGDYFAHWAPAVPNGSPIDASVHEAWLAGIPLPVGRLAESDRLRRALAGDFDLRLAATAPHTTRGLAALLWLTNQRGHEALLVGVQGSDLILRWPGPGTRHGLPAAPLRLSGFFEPSPPGAEVDLRIQRRGSETHVAREAAHDQVLGLWVGDGWRLLAPELRLSPAARSLLAASWLGGLWLPIGFWFAPSAGPLAALAAAATAMLLAPRVGSLLPTPGWQLAAAAFGFALGLLLRRRARRLAPLAMALLLAAGCRESRPETAELIPSPALPVCPDPTPRDALAVETLASGLEVPWDLGFAPDGRIFVTERPGRIRVIENGRLREQPWAELEVFAAHEAGLMGLAVDPDFATNRYVYAVGTFLAAPTEGLAWLADRLLRRALALLSPSAASIYASRVVRLEDRGGSGVDPRVIIDELPAEPLHAGGALDFAPDGSLFVTVGESERGRLARDPEALEGKLLRYQRDGRVPDDGPFQGSPVFALGFRNPQALAWDRARGALFAVEHGPSGLPAERGRGGNDELNVIEPGADYGWPAVAGSGSGGGLAWPVASWSPAIAPAGIAVYRGSALPWNGSVLVGGLRGAALRRLELEPAPGEQPAWRVRCQETLFSGELGRIRTVAVGPDARVYLTTSNRDGRGGPAPAGDDRVLRLSPRRRPASVSPIRPLPNRPRVAGSGTTENWLVMPSGASALSPSPPVKRRTSSRIVIVPRGEKLTESSSV